MKRILMLALAVLALGALPAFAEVKTHPGAKVSLDVPAGWKMDSHGDNAMTIMEPNGDVTFFLVVLDQGDIQKAATALDKEVAKIATDVKWASEKPASQKLNGMDALYNKATAKIKGKDAELGVILVKTPTGKALLILGGIDASKKDAHKDEVKKFIESIKPAA